MTVFASAGDDGSAQQDCNGDGGFFLSASTPASDPLVTGVGGTHLNANFTTGRYQSETVWNNSGLNPDFGAGGGGFSTKYPRPFYQAFANHNAARGVPDVTYNADVYGGVLATCSECGAGAGAFFIFGGTSAGSPQWAAITALADQGARPPARLPEPDAVRHRAGEADLQLRLPRRHVREQRLGREPVCPVTRPARLGPDLRPRLAQRRSPDQPAQPRQGLVS